MKKRGLFLKRPPDCRLDGLKAMPRTPKKELVTKYRQSCTHRRKLPELRGFRGEYRCQI